METGKEYVNISERMVFILGREMVFTKDRLFKIGFTATFISDEVITGYWNDYNMFKRVTAETLNTLRNGNAINIVNCEYIESYENEGLELECMNTSTKEYDFGSIYLTEEADEDYCGENHYISFTDFHKNFKRCVDCLPSCQGFKKACAESGFLFTNGFFRRQKIWFSQCLVKFAFYYLKFIKNGTLFFGFREWRVGIKKER